MLRLHTFRISHFSEKARWALDLSGLPYEENCFLPGMQAGFVRRHAPRSSVPLLEHDGAFVQESGAILDYLETALGVKRLAMPEADRERGRELEAMADRALGLGVQRIFYSIILELPRRHLASLWAQGSLWAPVVYRLGFPIIRKAVSRLYDTTPAAVRDAVDTFHRAYDTFDEILARQPYLLGDQMTRLDVTVAALLAPVCQPPEHGMRWPAERPEPITRFTGPLLGRPTSEHVRRMYQRHRRP